MRMVAEYLEHALQFELMASREEDLTLKAQFLKQADDYRRLASKRARQLGSPELAMRPQPSESN